MSRRPAFTVIEMVVVLIMVTLLFTLMMPQLSPTRAQLAEQEFWHSMRQNWQRAQATAQIQHRETNIIYKRDNQQILFFTSDVLRSSIFPPPCGWSNSAMSGCIVTATCGHGPLLLIRPVATVAT